MEGEMKRRIFAILEEVEVDAEGRIVVCDAIPEVTNEPSVFEAEPVAVAEEPVVTEIEEVAEEPAMEEVVATEEVETVEAETNEEPAVEEVVETIAEEVTAEEPVTEEVAASEALEEAPAVEAVAAVEAIGEVPAPKYVNKNFAQKMMLADEVIQDRYDEVKNYALRFKKLKARISKKFESINQGRLQFVKLSVAGKTLKLYLNMDVSETDPKFRCKDMRDKVTYETVPTMLRIKSGRAVRYAKILIDQCAAKYGLVENKKFVEVDAMKVVEDFLAEREAKKQAKLNGGVVGDEDVDYDVDTDALEEIAATDLEAIEEVVEEAAEEVAEEVVEEVAEEVTEEPAEEAAEEAVEETAEEVVEEAAEEAEVQE